MHLPTILTTLLSASAFASAIISIDPAQPPTTTEPATLEQRDKTIVTTLNYVVNTNYGLANGNKINPVATVSNTVTIVEPEYATYTGIPTHTFGKIVG